MKNHNRLKNFPLYNIFAMLTVIFFTIVFAHLEYNYILFNSIPYREAKAPSLVNFYTYDIYIFLPALSILAFYPLIYNFLTRPRTSTIRRTLALGIGNFLLGIILKDLFWFLFRTFTPISSDPLSHKWIKPSDFTATLLGYAEILGIRIPLWYIALSPIIISIFLSLIISQNIDQYN